MTPAVRGKLLKAIEKEFTGPVNVERITEWFENKHGKMADKVKLSDLLRLAEEAGVEVISPGKKHAS
ncbi:MAG: hypothetical protein ACPLTR_01970 [Thermacetogeniaceae bacterium]